MYIVLTCCICYFGKFLGPLEYDNCLYDRLSLVCTCICTLVHLHLRVALHSSEENSFLFRYGLRKLHNFFVIDEYVFSLCFQAFLEMADESAATSMVNYFTTCTAQLRGRAVYVQFSNHKELKTDQTHSNSVSRLGI